MQFQLSLRVADDLHEALLVRGEPLEAVEAARLLMASDNAPAGLCRQIIAALVRQDRRFCWADENGRLLSLRHWAAPDPDLADVPFVALDLETTGARAGLSKITEIGAVRIEGFREVRQFGTLVNPMRPIPPIISQITGITQEMVAQAPRIEEVLPELLEFLEGAVVVAHNASFDVGFLNYELERLTGRRLGEGAVDTLPLARALAPGLPNYRLQTVAEALGAPVIACHRALADAQAAGHVFVSLAGRLQERGITRLGEMRAYLNPSARMLMDKLRLTRDIPKTPGTYRFLDKEGQILYVGKAEHLRERVRSYFVANADKSRRLRQAIRLVERIDWDEARTPLEAVVDEQKLILQHRPCCNMYGTRPETYAYVKATAGGPGLNLIASCRSPLWLHDPRRQPSGRQALIIGPFRGRTRLGAALDLLHRCYPVRRCPRRPDDRPCVRSEHGRCLAPCLGIPEIQTAHDALVRQIMEWLAGADGIALSDPYERADELVKALSRQRRFEEAQQLQEAREHLLNVRRSYDALAEARSLKFAVFWPASSDGHEPSLRLNVVWNGVLRQPVSLEPQDLDSVLGSVLETAWQEEDGRDASGHRALVAVPQSELDLLLAVRRWFYESMRIPKLTLPVAKGNLAEREAQIARLTAEARAIVSAGTATLR
jgi:DNA polymerase-3 subunit epsilon